MRRVTCKQYWELFIRREVWLSTQTGGKLTANSLYKKLRKEPVGGKRTVLFNDRFAIAHISKKRPTLRFVKDILVNLKNEEKFFRTKGRERRRVVREIDKWYPKIIEFGKKHIRFTFCD